MAATFATTAEFHLLDDSFTTTTAKHLWVLFYGSNAGPKNNCMIFFAFPFLFYFIEPLACYSLLD